MGWGIIKPFLNAKQKDKVAFIGEPSLEAFREVGLEFVELP